MLLKGRSILVTGGSSGIGKAVAQACLTAGANVAICARNVTVLEETKVSLQMAASDGQRVVGIAADVSDPAGVDRLADATLHAFPDLDGLVNSAGILGPKGNLEENDLDDWIQTVQINLIGTMLVCRAFIPHFRIRGYGKIVNLSGGGATSPRPRFSAYAASKAAVVRLTENLAAELEGSGVFVNALAPGAVNTRMLEEVLQAGPEKVGRAAYDEAVRQRQQGGTPARQAAELSVMLLAPESDLITGRLISAVWDPWQSLPERKADLMKSDIYTLRRITLRDRGLEWQ